MPVSTRADLDARLHLLPGRGVLRRQGQRDAALVAVDRDDQHDDLGAAGRGLSQGALAAAGNLRDVQQPVDARQELHEHAELGRAHGAPAHDLPLAQPPATAIHGSPSRAFRLSEIRPFSWSILRTLTVTASPTRRRSAGRLTRECDSSDRGTSPCTPPRSTKAPKSASEATVPGSTAPGTIFLRVSSAISAALLLEQLAAGEDEVPAALAETS